MGSGTVPTAVAAAGGPGGPGGGGPEPGPGGGPLSESRPNENKITVQNQIRAWYRGICIMQTCHSDFATRCQKMDKWFTLIKVALTAITSSMIFTSINPPPQSGSGSGSATEEDVDFDADVTHTNTTNTLAMVAGILAAANAVIQSFHKALAHAEAGERHELAYKQFTALRFRLERLVTCGNFQHDGSGSGSGSGSVVVDEVKLREWANDYGNVLESAPIIPQAKFDSVRRKKERQQQQERYDNYNFN